MDIWGVGCVFFEMLSLFPLFPGTNEKDQVHKIHNILGTPHREILDRFQKYASHMDFNFPNAVGTGINQLIPHVTPECQELISRLLTYNPDERMTARQAINSSYFKELRAQDSKVSVANIHNGLGGGSSPTSGSEDPSVDGQDHQPPKRVAKPPEGPSEYIKIKKNQQGNVKKTNDHNTDNDGPNNVNNLFTLFINFN